MRLIICKCDRCGIETPTLTRINWIEESEHNVRTVPVIVDWYRDMEICKNCLIDIQKPIKKSNEVTP